MMTVAKQLEDAVYYAALQVADAGQRRRFLDQACIDNPELRAAVEEMLASQVDADRLIDGGYSALERTVEDLATSKFTDDFKDVVDGRIGKKIARYTILENLGDGGCGDVYLAE